MIGTRYFQEVQQKQPYNIDLLRINNLSYLNFQSNKMKNKCKVLFINILIFIFIVLYLIFLV